MEFGMFVYAWDLDAEGYDRVVGELADNGLTHLALATAYHTGKFLLPHNPRHRTYIPEDGSVYFQPDLARYGRIHPRVNTMVDGADNPVSRLREACVRRGIRNGAWVVLMHNSWLGSKYPDLTVQTPFGDPVIHSLNPVHPDVREYVLALVADLVRQHEIDVLTIEAPGYLGYTHGWHHEFTVVEFDAVQERLMSTSFSPADISGANDIGIDADRLRRRVADLLERAWNEGFGLLQGEALHPEAEALLNDPEFTAYQQWQSQQVLSLSQEIRDVVKTVNRGIEIRHFASLDGEAPDDALLRSGDAVLTGYASSDEDARVKAEAVKHLGMPVIGMIRGLPPDMTAPGQIARRVEAWRSTGVAGVETYNYGFLTRWSLAELYDALRSTH